MRVKSTEAMLWEKLQTHAGKDIKTMGLKYYQMNPHELVPRASAALRCQLNSLPTRFQLASDGGALTILWVIPGSISSN